VSIPSLEHEIAFVPSFDGSVLAVHPLALTDRDPLLVVPAAGPDLSLWRPTLRRSVTHRGALTWDLRGLHASSPPASDRIDAAAHVEDAVAVLDWADVAGAHVVSWGTGTRIAVELARAHPERVLSLAIVCGTHGYPARLLGRLDPTGLLPLAAGVGKHFSGIVGGGLRKVVARPEIAGLVRQSGLVAGTADVSALVDMLRAISACDTKRLLAILEALARDGGFAGGGRVAARALVIAGDRDLLAPKRRVRDLADAVGAARIEVYERATHFLPLEHPIRLAADLEAHAGAAA
jgi:3-oxoadipate enol-lactonase / 4-carboxymuconolactone decarboxylase